MTDILAQYAPLYWERGIPAIPLYPFDAGVKSAGKRPIENGWQRYSEEQPDEATKQSWIEQYPNANIGCPAGKASGLVFIDIDSDDPNVIAALESVLPKSPWKRIGSKGYVAAYRFNGEAPCKISQDDNGQMKMVVELMSTGNQIVLPPSIHPDTKAPYFSDTNLWEIKDSCPLLPDNIQAKLRAALSGVVKLWAGGKNGQKVRFTDFVSTGARDVKMTQMAGGLAHSVVKGEISLMRAIGMMVSWIENFTAKVDGDSLDVNKGIGKIVEFLRSDVTKGRVLPTGWDDELSVELKAEFGLDFTEEQQAWNSQQINDHIHRSFAETEGLHDPKRQQIVDFVLRKIAHSENLSELEIGQIINNLHKNSGLGVEKSIYNKQLKALRAGPIDGNNHTEIAKETIKLWEERNNKLAFTEGSFWGWQGDHWKKVADHEFLKVIANEFGELAAARKQSDHSGVVKIMRIDVAQELSAAPVAGVNFANGFLNTNLELVDHQPEHGCTYVLPYKYSPELLNEPDCGMPLFMAFLRSVWGKDEDFAEKVQALREAMAVTIFGKATSFQRAFLLMGVAGAGKSVILSVLQELVPASVRCSSRPDTWSKERFAPMMFAASLLNIAGELQTAGQIPDALFKQMIDGSSMDVPFPYQGVKTIYPRAAHWFGANDIPKTRDGTNGFLRRWLCFKFNYPVSPEDKIVDLDKMIIGEEMEAIAAWVVSAYPALAARGEFTIPASHHKVIADMAAENSTLRAWMNERIEWGQDFTALAKDLWTSHWSYLAASMGPKNTTPVRFYRQLEQILLELGKLNMTTTSAGTQYQGLRLKK